MKKNALPALLTAVLIFGECVCFQRVYAVESTQEKLNQAEEDYSDIQGQLKNAREDLDDLNVTRDTLAETLDELTSRLENIGDALGELESRIADKRSEIDETWGRIEELALHIAETEAAVEAQRDLAAAQIKYMYEQGDNLYILLLMSSHSYADYINKNSYIEMMSEYQRDQFDRYSQLCEELTGQQAEYERWLIKLEEEKAQLDEYETEVGRQQAKVSELVEKTSASLERYSGEIYATEASMLEIERQMAVKSGEIDTLRASLEEEQKITALAAENTWRDIADFGTVQGDRKLLANIIYCEAGNEPYTGQVAVGAVVMNRVLSPVFPDTVVGVIYQRGQFSPASSGRLALALAEDKATESCYQAADAALAGVTNVGNCLYFRGQASSITAKYTIGGHIFY